MLNNPLSTEQMVSIIRNGIRKTQTSKKIIIVGAGMSGLTAASLLKDAGHQVLIIEANDRIGGRAYTIRSPFSNGLYLNAGPLRIPEIHSLTLEYIKKFNLPLNEFINSTPRDIIYANGIKTTVNYYEKFPSILNYPVAATEQGISSEELLNLAMQPIIDFYNQDPTRNWFLIEKKYKNVSFADFLNLHFTTGAIDMIGVLLDFEAFMGMSFIEVLKEQITFTTAKKFYEITGGMDLLPKAFLPLLKDNILLNQKLLKIIQNNNSVTIQTLHNKTNEYAIFNADLAIITIPFSLLRFVEIEPFHSISYNKRKAIREINYLSATKIGIEFKSRFWERAGQMGGKTTTDLPIRQTIYPSIGIGSIGPAVVNASYTWADEALTLSSLTNEDRIYYGLQNMSKIWGNQVYSEFMTGTSFSWSQNPYSCGAFSFFEPGQEAELSPFINSPEGRIHFAGEHTSNYHAWIQGAIESGIRVANEVNNLQS
ncbi:flavin monoamine oxidase family protein [Gottfriedia luciferensis]|uniref:flavin monoamine oxidase family protein n=1 Tax=Gottfriedia luciferensis TaxID=178774 RepID=UPI001F3E1C04|nr:flavin monoamine oxidase family protein [Gottfriedia luciferensis]